MDPELHPEAAALREILESSSGMDARRALTRFVDRFAISRPLNHRALILRREMKRADDGVEIEALRKKALALVEEVVADHRAQADSEAAKAREEKVQRAREALLQQERPREVVFSAQGVWKTYKKSGFSLENVHLDLRQGEITGVVGRNGNGKTTLFRIVAGELRHDSGYVSYPLLDQYDESRLDWGLIKSEIAYVPQELPKWFGSLHDNLLYEAALHGLRGQENEREVEYIIERLDLRDYLGRKWKQLSGGYKLRFSLARALVWKPKLLILDEPLANLDFMAQEVVLQDLRNLADSLRYPLSVLVSSQHLHEVEAVSDNLVFLRQGETIYNGPMADLGEDRKENVYEVSVGVDLPRLKKVLTGEDFHSIHHGGIAVVIRTSLEVDAATLLHRLLLAGVPVEYFRDISRSSKQLFEEAEDVVSAVGPPPSLTGISRA